MPPDGSTPATIIDAAGAYIMPGFIDIHADYIEHMAAPRPQSVMKLRLAIHEADRELLTHGITTMFHSLAIYNNWDFGKNPIRKPENVQKLIELIAETHHSAHLIRHRFHARFEIDSVDRIGEVKGYMDDGSVHLLSFMDHTPGQGQYRDLELFRKTIKSYRNISDEEAGNVIAKSQAREKLTSDAITELASYATERGIAVASHDDDTLEKLELVKSWGCTISEFPITIEVARKAREMGLHTIAGAPNILLGGSHSGNLSAAEAVLDGSVDILCSDYYPAALVHAIFAMHREHGLPLADLVRLVTINPARAVNMDNETGSIAPGKKADLVIVRELEDGTPTVTGALVDGAHVFQTTYRR